MTAEVLLKKDASTPADFEEWAPYRVQNSIARDFLNFKNIDVE